MTPMRRRIITAAILLGAIAIAVVMVQLRPEPPRRPAESEVPLVTAERSILMQEPIKRFPALTVSHDRSLGERIGVY